MKRILIITFAVCAAIVAVAQTRADRLRKQLMTPRDGKVMVAVHRGDWRYAPENSIAAIKHCIDMGADIVELDLQLTKDSVLIVMHDETLNRTTNGKGRVDSWTIDSIRTLQLKNGCGIKTVHKVPTLEEAMIAAKGKILVNLDKADTYFDLLLPILRRTGTAGQVIMKSNRAADDVIAAFGEGLNEVIYMPKINFEEPGAQEIIADVTKKLKAPIHELKYASDKTLPDAVKGSKTLAPKSRIWYNTLWDTQCGGHDDEVALKDPDAAYGFLIKTLKTNVIQTDRAQMVLDYLRARKLHD